MYFALFVYTNKLWLRDSLISLKEFIQNAFKETFCYICVTIIVILWTARQIFLIKYCFWPLVNKMSKNMHITHVENLGTTILYVKKKGKIHEYFTFTFVGQNPVRCFLNIFHWHFLKTTLQLESFCNRVFINS